jgi:hypothetical protein
MRKKIINSAVFFTILYWLVVYVLQRRTHFLKAAPVKTWLMLAGGSLLLILLAKVLLPVFELVLKATAKVGNLIFGLVTVVVFFVFLTPIAWLMRRFGKVFMSTHFDPKQPTYYQPWQASDEVGKQY